MDERAMREAMDACRPASDDLQRPELAALAEALRDDPRLRAVYERVLSLDDVLRDGFQAVPLPEGLADRILAAAARAVPADPDVGADEMPALAASSAELFAPVSQGARFQPGRPPVDAGPPRKRRPSWRRITTAVAAVAALLLVTLAITWHVLTTPWGREQVVQMANDWTEELLERDGWNTNLAEAPTHTYPVPSYVLATPVRWQTYPTPLDRRSSVYQLGAPSRRQAVLLYVARPWVRPADLPDGPPERPQQATGGRCIGVWQDENISYVLVVHGDLGRYQRLVRVSSTLARVSPQPVHESWERPAFPFEVVAGGPF